MQKKKPLVRGQGAMRLWVRLADGMTNGSERKLTRNSSESLLTTLAYWCRRLTVDESVFPGKVLGHLFT